MKTRISKIAIGVQAVLCLGACQSLHKDDRSALRIAPTENVRHGAPRPEALYALGRYYQGQIRYNQAIDAYSGLLESEPHHAEGRNALGMILAAQGKYDQAIAQLEQAMADAPDSARIRNNLGYAYLLHGDFAKSIAILEMAAQLDPQNQRVQENLQTALASGGMEKTVVTQAVLPPVQVETITTTVETKAVSAAPAAASAAAVPAAGTVEGMRLKAVAPNVFSLEPAAQASAKDVALPVGPAAASGAGKRMRLEVANGNGVTGLARKTSRELQDTGYAKARLTNEQPYRLTATEIQYRPGFEPQARELQNALRPGVSVVASRSLRADVQVRLALGKDATSVDQLMARATAPRPGGSPGELADNNPLPTSALLLAHSTQGD